MIRVPVTGTYRRYHTANIMRANFLENLTMTAVTALPTDTLGTTVRYYGESSLQLLRYSYCAWLGFSAGTAPYGTIPYAFIL